MTIACILIAIIGLASLAAWFLAPTIRQAMRERRRLDTISAQMLAEHRIRVLTQQALASMRAAVRHQEGDGL